MIKIFSTLMIEREKYEKKIENHFYNQKKKGKRL